MSDSQPSQEWLDSARQYIVEKECDCDCFICARGDHDASDCPHEEVEGCDSPPPMDITS